MDAPIFIFRRQANPTSPDRQSHHGRWITRVQRSSNTNIKQSPLRDSFPKKLNPLMHKVAKMVT